MAKKQTSKIVLQVKLDENKIPESLRWTAEDGGVQDQAAKALFLSVWDSVNKESLRIDLWTKDMTVDEMKIFFHQTLLTMADTLETAINDDRIAGDMRDFCEYFAEKMEIKA